MPPGYVELDATKWLDYCSNCRVKVRRRWDVFTRPKRLLPKCRAQDVTRLGLHALPVLGRACLEAMFSSLSTSRIVMTATLPSGNSAILM
jgi:hypothetical protein